MHVLEQDIQVSGDYKIDGCDEDDAFGTCSHEDIYAFTDHDDAEINDNNSGCTLCIFARSHKSIASVVCLI